MFINSYFQIRPSDKDEGEKYLLSRVHDSQVIHSSYFTAISSKLHAHQFFIWKCKTELICKLIWNHYHQKNIKPLDQWTWDVFSLIHVSFNFFSTEISQGRYGALADPIPKYFILFHVILNEIVFWIFLSRLHTADILKHGWHFSVLTLCSATIQEVHTITVFSWVYYICMQDHITCISYHGVHIFSSSKLVHIIEIKCSCILMG